MKGLDNIDFTHIGPDWTQSEREDGAAAEGPSTNGGGGGGGVGSPESTR